jgi:hypothetical protein
MTDIRTTQAVVLAAGAYPAEAINSSQAHVQAAIDTDMSIIVPQAFILLAARGRVNDPHVRVWTFTLDGHDYYVLRLGNRETLIYDTHSEQWYVWGSGDGDLWRAYNGTNWLGGMTQGGGYGSSVVVGDDGNGSLYFLDPDGEVDDDALLGVDSPRPFQRVVQGQVVSKGYGRVPCYGVSLNGSIGEVDREDSTDVTLSVSDDKGETYTEVGTVSVEADDTDARVHWRSLGSIKTPGRLFKVVDYGALTRIDSLEMDDGE